MNYVALPMGKTKVHTFPPSWAEKEVFAQKYLVEHGAVARRGRLYKKGMVILKEKGVERKELWKSKLHSEREHVLKDLVGKAFDNMLTKESKRKRDDKLQLQMAVAEKAAAQTVQLPSLEDRKAMHDQNKRLRRLFHGMFALAYFLLLCGFCFMLFTIVFPILIEYQHRTKMVSMMVVESTTDNVPPGNYVDWRDQDATMAHAPKMDYYLYNITNVDDVVAKGAQPRVREMGPYKFTRMQHKYDVIFENRNPSSEDRNVRLRMDLVTYSVRFIYQYRGVAGDRPLSFDHQHPSPPKGKDDKKINLFGQEIK